VLGEKRRIGEGTRRRTILSKKSESSVINRHSSGPSYWYLQKEKDAKQKGAADNPLNQIDGGRKKHKGRFPLQGQTNKGTRIEHKPPLFSRKKKEKSGKKSRIL